MKILTGTMKVNDMGHVTLTTDDPDNDSLDLRNLFALLQETKRQQHESPKYFEMSHVTLYELERRSNLMPRTEPCSTLWGIEIRFNEKLPLNEIKPVY